MFKKEVQTETFTLTELQKNMKNFQMKLKWLNETNLYFSENNGRKNVLCFKNMVNYIINEKW